jgi:hypothetical protein
MAHAPVGPEGDPPYARAAGAVAVAVAVEVCSAEIQKRRRETVL